MAEEKDKKEYELSFWLKDEGGLEKIKALMANYGLEATYAPELRRMQLAYPINKETSAVFGTYHFMADSDIVDSLKKELKVESQCLRFMISNNPMKKVEEREYHKPQMSEKKPEKTEQKTTDIVTNEELEKKLEEILK